MQGTQNLLPNHRTQRKQQGSFQVSKRPSKGKKKCLFLFNSGTWTLGRCLSLFLGSLWLSFFDGELLTLRDAEGANFVFRLTESRPHVIFK